MPSLCPAGSDDASIACNIHFSRRRIRKFGPDHPIIVFRCFTHARYFNVYPMGWQPYGRKSLVPLTPDGADIAFHQGSVDAWSATLFQALVDASRGHRWPDTSRQYLWPAECALPVRSFRTQCRHIEGALRLFALDVKRQGEWPTLVARLGIDLSTFVGATGRVRDGPQWRSRGEMGQEVLSALGMPRRKFLPKFIDIGKNEGYWGRSRVLNC